jgi:hypothetical protein
MPDLPVPTVDKGLLAQYGLPTALLFAILGPLFGVTVWLMKASITDTRADITALATKVEKLREDVSFQSETVDLSCQPAKTRRRESASPP